MWDDSAGEGSQKWLYLQPMAYDEFLAERVRQILERRGVPSEEKKMMGGLIFLINEKMCVGVDQDRKTLEDRLMARIGKVMYEQVLEEKGARIMDFTGKPMRGFVFVYPDGIESDDDLEFWIDKALDFNKEAKKSKKRK
jgi:hypothetical protein